MSHDFQYGDLVRCVDATNVSRIAPGGIYTVMHGTDEYGLVGLVELPAKYDARRFELVGASQRDTDPGPDPESVLHDYVRDTERDRIVAYLEQAHAHSGVFILGSLIADIQAGCHRG